MAEKRVFRFSYLCDQRADRPLAQHKLRDADAYCEIAAVLWEKKFRNGGLLINFPKEAYPEDKTIEETRFLSSTDLLVLTTRPPLDDKPFKHRRFVTPSGTKFEQTKLFPVLRRYLRHCSRVEVTLSEELASSLTDGYVNRASLEFYQSAEAGYKSCGSYDKHPTGCEPRDEKATATYLLHTPPLWKGGPRLLTAFGMSGTMGLVWAYTLRTRFPEFVDDKPRFVMAEIVPSTPIPPPAQMTLGFADDWKATIIANKEL